MIRFIVNPKAGGGSAEKRFGEIKMVLDERKISYDVSFTEHRKHATELAYNMAERGADTIVVCGGDGTINEAVNGLLLSKNKEVKLGLLPLGTGNDFIRSAGLPTEPFAALERVLYGTAAPVDCIDVSGIKMLCFACAGIDADIVERCNAEKRKTKLSYVKNLVKCVFGMEWYSFKVEANGVLEEFEGAIVSVLNGWSIASGLPYCPEAKVDDGQLNVVAVKRKGKLGLLFDFVAIARGRAEGRKGILNLTAESVKIECSTPVIDIDGELYYDLPFNATVCPCAVKLIR